MKKIENYLEAAVTLNETGQKEIAKELGKKYLEIFSNEMVKSAKKTFPDKKIDVKRTKEGAKKYIIEQLRLSDNLYDQIFYQEILGFKHIKEAK